ncbi:uncharacterized protein [Spinacia oleracea]|uniref:CCHC-type domain-containing protein n=1 Tax=Spinacia oleracea TaxID=3562 RepID=A0ABM3R9P4_SPIOL|nr:uncharacterized protein LOC110777376 [Spinacia oleracea]XP_056692336.1 uncharacterized protein LOC110777376 [Spinacia oleracea]
MQEEKEYVLEEAMPEAAGEGVTQATLNHWIDANKDVKCLMLATMSADLQKTFINSDAFTIISELKNMFQDLARVERFETHRQILRNAKKGGNKASQTKQPGGTKSEKKKVSQPTSESECFYCKKKGHWKRDCLKLKEDQKNGTVVPSSGTKKK